MSDAAGPPLPRRPLGVCVTALCLAASPVLFAAEYVGAPGDYAAQLAKMSPGDRLLLRPGQYPEGLRIHHLKGTTDAPIVIEGPDAGDPAVFVARADANTVSILESAHVVIRHLVLDGRNLPVDAVKAEGTSKWAHHIALEHLLIVNHGSDQQIVAISAQSPAWNWVIRGNVIVGAGTGMYLGSSDGRRPFVHGVIEGNVILDTIGYNLQVKHQAARPAIDGMPSSDGTTVIRGNVFVKGDRSSRGGVARPNVLVGHFPDSGPGVEDRYLVEGNAFIGNPAEALFQGEGNVALAGNLFVNPHGDGVAIQPHNAAPRRIEIAHNLFATRGFPLRVRGTDPRYGARIHDNTIVELSDAGWEAIGDRASRSTASIRRAIERWLRAGSDVPSPAAHRVEQALRLACHGGAGAPRYPGYDPLPQETLLPCALVPGP